VFPVAFIKTKGGGAQLIKISTDQFKNFIDFLNDLKLTDVPCILVILPAHEYVEDGSGQEGFAAYDPEENIIYVAGKPLSDQNLSDKYLYKNHLQNITHEYIHHIQSVENRGLDEDEAVKRAGEIVTMFLMTKEIS
jgi:hypothetical protein